MSKIIDELSWRGLIYDKTPGLTKILAKNKIVLYVGFDPTYDSLHIGNLLVIIILIHFIKDGHKPLIIIGGATGIIGDPSYKNKERLSIKKNILNKNINNIKLQINKYLGNIEILNNFDWIKDINIIDFLLKIGKYININYMLSKESVKNRLKNYHNSISFTEFSYQLFQGYDYFYLNKYKNCLLQIGGSDQWGNITTGINLIERKTGNKVYGLTFPLITKSDGSKFGKSESGVNIWLDTKYTSPYNFFQFWMNLSDIDAEKYIKIYTFIPKNEIYNLILLHKKKPSNRILQNRLAIELTNMVHGEKKANNILNISKLFFNKNFIENINHFDKKKFISFLNDMPQVKMEKKKLEKNILIIPFLVKITKIFKSNKEAYRFINQNSIFINKICINHNYILGLKDIIYLNKYFFLQIGKKKLFIVNII